MNMKNVASTPALTSRRWKLRFSSLSRILLVQFFFWISYIYTQGIQGPDLPRALDGPYVPSPMPLRTRQNIQKQSTRKIIDDNRISTNIQLVTRTNQNNVAKNKSVASPNIPIFYNLFVGAESDASRVENLVSLQMAAMNPELHYPVLVNSIGYKMEVPNATMLGHYNNGTEMITLRSLWTYCKENPLDRVVYLHSKGSFTDTFQNGRLRRFLTTGALSEQCANLPDTCDVCSSRFSPLPHPHTSGNMWLARCEYVQRLVDPYEFSDRMEAFATVGSNGAGEDQPSCDGRLRYSAEHWIASHPSIEPCDLYPNKKFKWGYAGVPKSSSFEMRLKRAPRFDAMEYVMWPECAGRGMDLQQRLLEYEGLYQQRPDDTWWGWKFFEQIEKSKNRLPYYQLFWYYLSPALQRVATDELGYSEKLWDTLHHPPMLNGKLWETLDETHRSSLEKLGYQSKSWDSTLFQSPRAAIDAKVASQNLISNECPSDRRIAQGLSTNDRKDDDFSKGLIDMKRSSVDKRKGKNKRLLILATVPKNQRHVIALWSQLECFTTGVDHVVISAPKWSKHIVDKISNAAKSSIPHFARGKVRLTVQLYLNNRYDVGLWCDALEATDSGRYDEFGLLNDSVFALREFTGIFDALRAKNVSLTSMSYSYTPKWLVGQNEPKNFWVESVFRGFDKAGIATFQDHSCVAEDHPFFCPELDDNKACIINNFEHDLVTTYPCESVYGLYPSDTPKKHLEKNQFRTWVKNPEYWRDLVENLDFPISKVKETSMIARVSDPALSMCKRFYNHSLLDDFDLTLAKPFHQRGWKTLDKPLQRVARLVLGMDKDTWKDWSTSKYGSKSYKELTSEQQFVISQLFECSELSWNSNACGPQKKSKKKGKKSASTMISLAEYKTKSEGASFSSGTTTKIKQKFIDRFRFT